MRSPRGGYIPAFHYHLLTRLFDPFMRWVMSERVFKEALVEAFAAASPARALDVACGTGTLAVMMKEALPDAVITGIDIDPKVLALAALKARDAGVDISFEQASAAHLPFEDGAFDCVVSSVAMHHLTALARKAALAECLRVLSPGGELAIVDFGRPEGVYGRLVSLVMRRLEETSELIAGQFAEEIRAAGFEGVAETRSFATVMGTLVLYRAKKPGERSSWNHPGGS